MIATVFFPAYRTSHPPNPIFAALFNPRSVAFLAPLTLNLAAALRIFLCAFLIGVLVHFSSEAEMRESAD